MVYNQTYKKGCETRGKSTEEIFKNAVESIENGRFKCTKSSSIDDMEKHVDFYITDTVKNSVRSVDVKSSNADDGDLYRWIEISNVQGKKGWLYGDSFYIAFKLQNSFILVNRNVLINFIEENLKDEFISKSNWINNKEAGKFKKYGRDNRADVLTIISMEDLKKLSKWIIKY